jgi:hypothetical protein
MVKWNVVTLLAITMGTACDRDKECVAPPLSQNIVGTWNAALQSSEKDIQEVTFMNDKSFKESNGLLFGTFFKPEVTWEVKNDSLILKGTFTNKSTATYEMSARTNSCDQIILDIEGLDQLKLTKK